MMIRDDIEEVRTVSKPKRRSAKGTAKKSKRQNTARKPARRTGSRGRKTETLPEKVVQSDAGSDTRKVLLILSIANPKSS